MKIAEGGMKTTNLWHTNNDNQKERNQKPKTKFQNQLPRPHAKQLLRKTFATSHTHRTNEMIDKINKRTYRTRNSPKTRMPSPNLVSFPKNYANYNRHKRYSKDKLEVAWGGRSFNCLSLSFWSWDCLCRWWSRFLALPFCWRWKVCSNVSASHLCLFLRFTISL